MKIGSKVPKPVVMYNGKIQGYKLDGSHNFTYDYEIIKGMTIGKIEGDYFQLANDEGTNLWFKVSDFTATKEEIMKTTERKIIGYRIIKQYPGIEKKYVGETILESNLFKLSDGTFIGAKIFNPKSEFYNKDFLTEFFQPIYEEEYKVGDWVIGWHANRPNKTEAWQIEKITEKYVYAKGEAGTNTGIENIRKATPEEIKKATEIKIGEYEAKFLSTGDKVNFGCQYFSKTDIETVKTLVSSPVNAKIEIKGVNITEQLLDKIINRMK